MAEDDDIVIEDGSEIQEGETIFGDIDPLVDLSEIEKTDEDFQEELDKQYNETFAFGDSWSFNFVTGQFNKKGDKQVEVTAEEDSFAQWCMLVLHTERGSSAIFSEDIGLETEDIISGSVPAPLVSGILEERIIEALSVHDRFQSLDDFSYDQTSSNIAVVSLSILTTEANTVDIETEIRIG